MTTLTYYNQNAISFVEETINVDFKIIQNHFINRLLQGAAILHFGCSFGRDTKYFLEQGFNVTATNGSKELCKIASEYTEISVKQMLFLDLDDVAAYDGI